MIDRKFHPAVELLTSSTGGSIHIVRFIDQDYFKLFSDKFLIRNQRRLGSSLEFCFLNSEQGREEALLINTPQPELHFHGGVANVESVRTLCKSLPCQTHSTQKPDLSQHWSEQYRRAQAENSINYLLSIKERARNNDLSLLEDRTSYHIEGYDYLKPVSIMFIGPPNAGKSTFFNYLVGEQRALVSEVEGTTRDSLSARLSFGGYEVQLIDSAGLREDIFTRGIQKHDPGIQTQSENLVLDLAQNCDLFCVFNSPNSPDWIPASKILHVQSKAETQPAAHPEALSFSVHQNTGCEKLIQVITDRVKTLKAGKISTHFIPPDTFP